LAIESIYHELPFTKDYFGGYESDNNDTYYDNDHVFDFDSEWRYPSKEVLALEEKLTDPAKAALARLDKVDEVIRLKKEGFKIIKVALVVLNSSVVKVLFAED
jgi:hypothetical protein